MTDKQTISPLDLQDRHSTLYLYAIVLVAAVGGFLWGYDLSLISGAGLVVKRTLDLSEGWFGVVTGSAILGCPFGPLLGVWLADHLGRKRTLILSALVTTVSTIGCSLASGAVDGLLQRLFGSEILGIALPGGCVIDLILWRFIGGMGVGLASTVSPMYIAEIAPARLRGVLVTVNQLAIVIGLSLSVLVTYWLSFGNHWRWMFATQGIPVAGLLAGLLLVPESPRWLAAVGRQAGALAVLLKINGREKAETELRQIENELGDEPGGFAELFRPGIRAAVIIGLTLMVLSQINGVNMILIYTPHLFVQAGITDTPDAILNSVYIDAWITVCTVIAFWLTQKFSRRSILIVGTIGMALGHLLMFLGYTYHLSSAFMLLAMFVPTGAFTLTLAPLSWVVLSELYPNRVRGKAMSIATCAMFISSFIATYWFPTILKAFSDRYGNPGGTFLIFLGVCLTCSLFVWRSLPETKDITLEEIGEFWLRRA
jgi:sugar porter (SP) family MFS transporter